MFLILGTVLIALLGLSCATDKDATDRCVDDETKILKCPLSQSASYDENKVEFNCVGCGDVLSFDIIIANSSEDEEKVICTDQSPYVGEYYKVKKWGGQSFSGDGQPYNCSLYVYPALVNVAELLVKCELTNLSSSLHCDAHLKMSKSVSTLPSDPPISSTVTDNISPGVPGTTETIPSTSLAAIDTLVSTTMQPTPRNENSTLHIVLPSILGACIFMIVVAVISVLLVVWCYKRRKGSKSEPRKFRDMCGDNFRSEDYQTDSQRPSQKLPREVRQDGAVRRRGRNKN